MHHVAIIGAGGVARAAAHKFAAVPETFSRITLASRTLSKCETIAHDIEYPITTVELDANHKHNVIRFIETARPDVIVNLALPYQNLAIMNACLETGVHYVDTALAEEQEEPDAFYEPQWEYHDRFKEAGITGILGCGFDPGVTGVFVAYARKHLFDEIHHLDILDCNGGDHGLPFATNFNPEINIREITLPARHWENGALIETPALSTSREFDFPGVGKRRMYLIWHEELQSLVKNIPHLERARFWMTFSDSYLEHLRVLENIGMTSMEPVTHDGIEVIPLRFLTTLLPDPSALGPRTKGSTCIGCVLQGIKDNEPGSAYIYNICSHEKSFAETGTQAVSYTTGVPAMIGTKLLVENKWRKPGIWNVEQFDPDPFMEQLQLYGLPWTADTINQEPGNENKEP